MTKHKELFLTSFKNVAELDVIGNIKKKCQLLYCILRTMVSPVLNTPRQAADTVTHTPSPCHMDGQNNGDTRNSLRTLWCWVMFSNCCMMF